MIFRENAVLRWSPRLEENVSVREDEDKIIFSNSGGKAEAKMLFSADDVESWLDGYGVDLGHEEVLVLDDIVVEPKSRGTGLGAELMQAVITYAKSAGAEAVYLNASPTSTTDKGEKVEGLIAFYEKFGFQMKKKYSDNAFMCLTL